MNPHSIQAAFARGKGLSALREQWELARRFGGA